VWEELDRAAAWVSDHWTGDAREEVRHALRVLCIALRNAPRDPAPGAEDALRVGDLPWRVPVAELACRLRRRLVEQLRADAYPLGIEASEVAFGLVAALDRVEVSARADGARSVMDQLGGTHALELLVEVAHDMRSPLGSILFLVERLRDGGGLDGPQARQLALVYGAAFGLSTVVSDVMELARGGDRLAAGAAAALDLTDLVAEVRAIVAPLAEERGVELAVQVGVAGKRVGRATALHRVLLNLVTNALKFTPEGLVTLEVGAEAASADRVAFTVADSGRGMPPAVLEQLFQTFRRGPDTRSHAFSSAGLGLAICQKLVSAMGGVLEVESAVGEGTRFRFVLEMPVA
jgi:signal transduction histidine kinase